MGEASNYRYLVSVLMMFCYLSLFFSLFIYLYHALCFHYFVLLLLFIWLNISYHSNVDIEMDEGFTLQALLQTKPTTHVSQENRKWKNEKWKVQNVQIQIIIVCFN
uniref:Uncharacterized protein n=1 Tax=Cacopsylla melanoneura TaxID=428564 RepID=A0A8D8SCF6_9HEMI